MRGGESSVALAGHHCDSLLITHFSSLGSVPKRLRMPGDFLNRLAARSARYYDYAGKDQHRSENYSPA